jgi:hypothetical protein
MHVNKSGSMAKGPRPKARKPKAQSTIGFEVRAVRSKTIENIINPIVNSDFVLVYMPMYRINRMIKSAMLIVETTVLTV